MILLKVSIIDTFRRSNVNTIERSVQKYYAFVYVPDGMWTEYPEPRVYSDIGFARKYDEYVGEFENQDDAQRAAELHADSVAIQLGLDVMAISEDRLLDYALSTFSR